MNSAENKLNRSFRPARMSCRVALFDMDGTLVETDAANTAAYRVALAAFGIGLPRATSCRITGADVCRYTPNLSTVDLAAIARAKKTAYASALPLTWLGPATAALRESLQRRDLFARVVLLTESKACRAHETLRHHGLLECFDEIVCNGGRGDKYTNFFTTHAVDPADCVVWENEDSKVKSAITAGVKIENIRKVA
ncbi:MAG: hypothetical protein Q4G65_14860 [bacterium]|nr:hypothetical protein [bacterium]